MKTKKLNCDTRDKQKIAIYSRKSKFTGKGESIENQIDMCLKYIQNNMVQFSADSFDRDAIMIYEDEGFSGSTLNRPEFIRMMDDAEKGLLSAIVVYRLDRISRNTADFTSLISHLDRLGIDFISIRERFDTSTPMGRAMMYMSSVFSQLERETIAERIRDNMHELARTGRWLGGITPTGFASESYTYTDLQGKLRKACRLVPVSDQLAAVSTIYSTFLTTASLSRTEALLSASGLRTKTGRPYTRYSLKTILTNPVYAAADRNTLFYLQSLNVQIASPVGCFDGNRGLMVYNKTDQQPGRAHKKKPPSQWIAAAGQHPAAIRGAEWTAVQQIFDNNRKYRNAFSGNCGSDFRCLNHGLSVSDSASVSENCGNDSRLSTCEYSK